MVQVYRFRRAMPLAQTAPDTPEDLHLRFFLACEHLPLEFDLPQVCDHRDRPWRADKGALGTPDAFLIGDGNPSPECTRNWDLFFRVQYRERF